MNLISVIILNSDKRDIKKTLESVKWCDEVIVWTKPINGDWGKARNEAMATAKNEWVLFIDSDEVLSTPLRQDFVGHSGYRLNRFDVFWGKTLKHGEVCSTKLVRLGKKTAAGWMRKVHEYWDIKNVGESDSYFLHYPHPTIKEFIDSINRYTDIDADELYNDGKRVTYLNLIANPVGKFLLNYFCKLGFLDGVQGFVYAFLMSFHSLTVRVKMATKYGFSAIF